MLYAADRAVAVRERSYRRRLPARAADGVEANKRFRYVRLVLIRYKGRMPQIDPTAYVQDCAQIIGDVVIGPQSSVWFNVVIRGDVHHIRIGARTNIQDNSTLHGTRDRWPTIVGDDVTVAHGAILHGCTIAARCLIGMGAIVMDGVDIGENCLVAAGALVTPGTEIPAGHLVIGSPAVVARLLRPEELAHIKQSALNYVVYAESYRAEEKS
jgi:carbonic anhydrase/acetyltransferase-like protein (isoleucine patch superfamily)